MDNSAALCHLCTAFCFAEGGMRSCLSKTSHNPSVCLSVCLSVIDMSYDTKSPQEPNLLGN